MSVITFPTNITAATAKWSQRRRDMVFASSFGSQAMEISAPLWAVNLSVATMSDSSSGALKAMLLKLRGKVNQLALWDFGRPAPLGTMRGTMTLNGAHAQGAVTLNISAAGQGSTTVKQGDMFGIDSTNQVVMAVADATADGSGNVSFAIEPPLRDALSGGAAVTWDKPKALFRITQSDLGWDYTPGLIVSGFALDLIEDWRT